MKTKKNYYLLPIDFYSSTFFAELSEKGLGHKINGHDTLAHPPTDGHFIYLDNTFSILAIGG